MMQDVFIGLFSPMSGLECTAESLVEIHKGTSSKKPVSNQTLVEAQGLTFGYGDTSVLHNTQLRVKFGERVALLGPSGSGKSTFLRVLAGITKPHQGTIEYGVIPDAERGERKVRIGFMFQAPVLLPWRSVWKNIALAARLSGADDSRETSYQWSDAVGLQGLEERLPIQLSGGQRQRAALARCLATRPDLLLLDEPFAALDRDRRRKLLRLVDGLAKDHKIAIVMVTHDPQEVTDFVERYVQIDGQGGLQESEWWKSDAI